MGNTNFARIVLTKMQDFSCRENYFFLSQVEHMLSGFFCELTPQGAYLWKFIYPLFDRFKGLSLLYSERFPSPAGYIDFSEISKSNLAEEFVARLKDHLDGAKRYLSIPQFCGYFVERPALLKHSHARMVLGYAETLMGHQDQALAHLSTAMPGLQKPYLNDCQMIFDLARVDMKSAKKEILRFESEMRKQIGLSL